MSAAGVLAALPLQSRAPEAAALPVRAHAKRIAEAVRDNSVTVRACERVVALLPLV